MVEKRERNLFKKLLNYRVGRMLKVLKYYPSQSDERKFLHSNYKNQMNAGAQSEYDVSPRSEISVGSPLPDANFRKRNISTVAYAYQQSSGMGRDRMMAPPSFTDLSQQNYMAQMQNNIFKMNQGSLQSLLNTVTEL